MNKQNFLILLTFILIIVVIFSFFTLTLYKTRAIKETRLVLELNKTDTTNTKYSLTNLNELEAAIEKLNTRFGENSLLQIYERERQHYILLLTVLAILLTISIAYGIIKSFIDKNDFIDQENRINKLEADLTKELEKVKCTTLMSELNSIINDLVDKDFCWYNDENKVISNNDELIQIVKSYTKDILMEFNNRETDVIFKNFNFDIMNLIIGTLDTAFRLKFEKNIDWNAKTNSTFKLLTIWIEDCLGSERYSKMKERVCKIENVIWE